MRSKKILSFLVIIGVLFFSVRKYGLYALDWKYEGRLEYGVLETNDLRDKLYRSSHSRLDLSSYFIDEPDLSLKWSNNLDYFWFNLTDYGVERYTFDYLYNKFNLSSQFYLSANKRINLGFTGYWLNDSLSPYSESTSLSVTEYFLNDMLLHKMGDAYLYWKQPQHTFNLIDKYDLLEEDILDEMQKRRIDFGYTQYFDEDSSLSMVGEYFTKDYRYSDVDDYSWGDVTITYQKYFWSEKISEKNKRNDEKEEDSGYLSSKAKKQLDLNQFKLYKSFFTTPKEKKPLYSQLEVSYLGRFNNQPHSPYGDFNLNGVRLAFTTNFSKDDYFTLYDQFEYQEYEPEAIYYETNRTNELGYYGNLKKKKWAFNSSGFYRFRNDMHFSGESYYMGYIGAELSYFLKGRFKSVLKFVPAFTYVDYDQTDTTHNDYGDYSLAVLYEGVLNEVMKLQLGYEYRRFFYDRPDEDYSNFNDHIFSLTLGVKPKIFENLIKGKIDSSNNLELGIKIENLNYEQKDSDSEQNYFTWIGWRSLLF